MAAFYKKGKFVFIFGIGIGRLTQNDYHQYTIRLRRRVTQTIVFHKLSCNMCVRFWEEEIWYHKKCTQRTFTVSTKAITQFRTDFHDWTKEQRNAQRQ